MLLYLFFRKLYEASSTASMRKEFSDMQLIHEKVNYTMLIQNIGKTYTWSEELKSKLISDGNKPLKIWNTIKTKAKFIGRHTIRSQVLTAWISKFYPSFLFLMEVRNWVELILKKVDLQQLYGGTSRFSHTLLIILVVSCSIPVSTGSRCCYFCWWIGHHLPSSSFILS